MKRKTFTVYGWQDKKTLFSKGEGQNPSERRVFKTEKQARETRNVVTNDMVLVKATIEVLPKLRTDAV